MQSITFYLSDRILPYENYGGKKVEVIDRAKNTDFWIIKYSEKMKSGNVKIDTLYFPKENIKYVEETDWG